MGFLERVEELCAEKNISKRKLEREAGLGVGSSSKWNKYTPNATTTSKIAEYFNVSLSYLMGESDFRTEKEAVLDGWNKRFADIATNEVQKIEAGVRIPVIGEVPCGIPLEAIELIDADDWEEIPESMAKSGKYFGLKVKGDSMSPRMVEGDILIVKKQPDAESGDIVIAKVHGNEATCKKFIKHDNGISLVPYNSAYEPMYFSNKDLESKSVTIVGKVVELRGKFQ